jgi:hypothetical protein
VNTEPEHLRKYPGHAVRHDRRAIGDLVQELDDLARLDRPGIAASPAGEHLGIEDPLHVFRTPALAVDVPGHVFASQVSDRMLGWALGLGRLRPYTRGGGDAGPPRINATA